MINIKLYYLIHEDDSSFWYWRKQTSYFDKKYKFYPNLCIYTSKLNT